MKLLQIFSISILCSVFFGCGPIKLIDIPKSSSALQLTAAQQKTIQPKLKLIRDIVDDYDFEKSSWSLICGNIVLLQVIGDFIAMMACLARHNGSKTLLAYELKLGNFLHNVIHLSKKLKNCYGKSQMN